MSFNLDDTILDENELNEISDTLLAVKLNKQPPIEPFLDVVYKYIRENNRVIYGGTAYNRLLLNVKAEGIYNKREIPDLDFLSPEAQLDAQRIADIFKEKGHRVKVREGIHEGVFRVDVDTYQICDMSQIDDFDELEYVEIDNLRYVSDHFLKMSDMYELSSPANYYRWAKVSSRIPKLLNAYPVEETQTFNKVFKSWTPDFSCLYKAKTLEFAAKKQNHITLSGPFVHKLYADYYGVDTGELNLDIPVLCIQQTSESLIGEYINFISNKEIIITKNEDNFDESIDRDFEDFLKNEDSPKNETKQKGGFLYKKPKTKIKQEIVQETWKLKFPTKAKIVKISEGSKPLCIFLLWRVCQPNVVISGYKCVVFPYLMAELYAGVISDEENRQYYRYLASAIWNSRIKKIKEKPQDPVSRIFYSKCTGTRINDLYDVNKKRILGQYMYSYVPK
jgi:hypothetical protein